MTSVYHIALLVAPWLPLVGVRLWLRRRVGLDDAARLAAVADYPVPTLVEDVVE